MNGPKVVVLPVSDLCDFPIDAPALRDEAAAVQLSAVLRLDDDVAPSGWPDGRALRYALQSLLN